MDLEMRNWVREVRGRKPGDKVNSGNLLTIKRTRTQQSGDEAVI